MRLVLALFCAGGVYASHWAFSIWIVNHVPSFNRFIRLEYFSAELSYHGASHIVLLAAAKAWESWIFIGLAVVLCLGIIYNLFNNKATVWSSFAFGLILGAVFSGLWQRINDNYVVNYFKFAYGDWLYYFSLLDIFILLGGSMLMLSWLFARIVEGRG